MNENNKSNTANSKALFAMGIVTMSFAILAFVVVATAMLTRWIMDLNRKIKESNTQMAKASARIDKFRKGRIKHILTQRKQQIKEEKAEKKRQAYENNKKFADSETDDDTADELQDLEELDELEELDALGDIVLEELENQL